MKRRGLLAAFCLLAPCMAMAARVEATLDRANVHLGETVTLNLHVDDAMSVDMPDLRALQRDFDVLDTSTQNSFSIINGRPSADLDIGIALLPKHQGDLVIPPLAVSGSQTHPLTLHVGAADTSVDSHTGKDVYLQAVTSAPRAYVGQPMRYTVRLFYSGELGEGSLSQPQVEGAQLRQLGRDSHYETMRNGRRYHVVERHYALTPQHAGELVIPPAAFQGDLISLADSGGSDAFFNPSNLFGTATPVTAHSPQVKVDVQAPPADWGKTSWLPARSLTLRLEGLPSEDKVTVGQPLNLRLSVDAQGLPGDALPPLSLPAIDGAAIYPDPSSTTTHDDNEGPNGHSERNFAIFPQRAGVLTLPELTLTWFDVKSGQKRVATIPAHRLTVLAAPSPAVTTAWSSVAPSSVAVSPAGTTPPDAKTATLVTVPAASWRWLALGSIALWLLGAAAFAWRYARKRSSAVAAGKQDARPADSARSLRQAFLDAARGSNRAVQARCLLAWARAERPGLRNLGEVADALESQPQRTAIALMQREQYASASPAPTLELAAIFANGLAWRQKEKPSNDASLPPLYPFKLD